MSRPKITIICKECNKSFLKDRREYNRRIKNGKLDFFCNLSCSKRYTNIKLDMGNRMKGNLTIGGDNRSDEYSPFKYYLRKAKVRDKNQNLDLQYLKDLWIKQEQRCAYSSLPLHLNPVTHKGKLNPIYLASLDRINSSQGYIKGNVQFISASLNYAKNDMDHLEFMKGLRDIVEFYNTKKYLVKTQPLVFQ